MEVINYLLGYKKYHIYQNTEMFNFSLDSVLLPNFVTINATCKNILDIGCGNAPIPLILSTKTNAHIVGVEIQKEVYELAVKSVELNSLNSQIEIINGDINNLYSELETEYYDTITCNPPYFKVNERAKLNDSEYKKIARHEVTLNLEQIFKIAKKLLKNNGNIAIVNRPERLVEIIEIMKKNNIEPKRLQFIYPKKDSMANTILIEGTKNGKPGLKIEEPIFAHCANGNYTRQVKKYFK